MELLDLLQAGQTPIMVLILVYLWKLDRRVLKIEIHLEIDEP